VNIVDNLIANGAWQTILNGLLVTLQISALGLLLGTILGALFCATRRSPHKILSLPTKIIISFMRGTPVLLLLMFLYFVAFSGIRVSAILIAVLAFGLAPRACTGIGWGAFVLVLLLSLFGPLLRLSHWVLGISPFTHAPHLPGGPVSAAPLLWLSLIAVALAAAGLAGLRRRDLAT